MSAMVVAMIALTVASVSVALWRIGHRRPVGSGMCERCATRFGETWNTLRQVQRALAHELAIRIRLGYELILDRMFEGPTFSGITGTQGPAR